MNWSEGLARTLTLTHKVGGCMERSVTIPFPSDSAGHTCPQRVTSWFGYARSFDSRAHDCQSFMRTFQVHVTVWSCKVTCLAAPVMISVHRLYNGV